MSNANDFAKTCREVLGIKGRFLLFALGVAGLFFPGIVMHSLLIALTKCLKDYDVQKLLTEIQD